MRSSPPRQGPLPNLLLASQSPRRADLLRTFGLHFDIEPSNVDETPIPGETPADHVWRLAEDKAWAVIRSGHIIVGADTTVVIDGQMLGKPKDPDDAHRMLRKLSGRTHEVITGVAVVFAPDGEEAVTRRASECTDVRFRDLTFSEIDWYVGTGEPRDKAGAYGIQGLGGDLVATIKGSYHNVVGLPLTTLAMLFKDEGYDLLDWAR
jgi:septum formation protein